MKIKTIQALRALAAISVISYHIIFIMINRIGYSINSFEFGAIGVDLFFVISGFIMVYTNDQSFEKPNAAKVFLLKRLIRIVPLYWFCTSLIVILMIFSPSLFSTTKFDLSNTIRSYLFILSEVRPGDIGTLLQTGWTLCYEMYFYLLFALALFFNRQYLLMVLGSFFALGIALGSMQASPTWLKVASDPILFEFLWGCLIAFLFLKYQKSSPIMVITSTAFLIASLLAQYHFNFGIFARFMSYGLASGLVLAIAIFLEELKVGTPCILESIGESSYSLYLFHPLILSLVAKLYLLFDLSKIMPPQLFF